MTYPTYPTYPLHLNSQMVSKQNIYRRYPNTYPTILSNGSSAMPESILNFILGKQPNFLGRFQKVQESPDIFYERNYPRDLTTNVPCIRTFIFTEFRRSKASFGPNIKRSNFFGETRFAFLPKLHLKKLPKYQGKWTEMDRPF